MRSTRSTYSQTIETCSGRFARRSLLATAPHDESRHVDASHMFARVSSAPLCISYAMTTHPCQRLAMRKAPVLLTCTTFCVQTFTPLVEKCKRLNRAMRIGTNHGSLSARILSYYGDTPRGMVESAFEFADICRCRFWLTNTLEIEMLLSLHSAVH